MSLFDGNGMSPADVAALEPMYDQAQSEHERQVITNTINRIRTAM